MLFPKMLNKCAFKLLLTTKQLIQKGSGNRMGIGGDCMAHGNN